MPRHRTSSTVLFATLAVCLGGCAAPHDSAPGAAPQHRVAARSSSPTADALGDRVRVRIAGREVPSITSADYFVSMLVLDADGRRLPIRVALSESTSCEGQALAIGHSVFTELGLEGWPEVGASRHGPSEHCADFVLPPGVRLCFEPDTFYAYRIVDSGSTMVADLAPEVHVGQLRADGSEYVELQPSDGPELRRAEDPPGWPPRR